MVAAVAALRVAGAIAVEATVEEWLRPDGGLPSASLLAKVGADPSPQPNPNPNPNPSPNPNPNPNPDTPTPNPNPNQQRWGWR